MRWSVLFGAAIPLLLSQAVVGDCKCALWDSCWPTNTEWEALNTTLGGRLIRASPPGAICYPERPEYNATACDAVIAGWGKSSWHSAHPVSILAPAMANDSCNPIYPNGSSVTGDVHAGARGCSIGMYPPYVINATDATHIQAALRFAKNMNLRLTIKNTGHNGSGRKVGYGSLSIWTHNLKNIVFRRNFVPQGNCSMTTNIISQMAVTLGAGIQDGELFAAVAKNNAMAVGGTSMDVGVVGWATGGGHGSLTAQYSQGADNIIQAVLVTPTGEVITANECQNADIFWAIRGGGGSTFGVIVNITMKAYPMPSVHMMGLTITAKSLTTAKQSYKFVADVHRLIPTAQDQGMSGYWTMGGDPSLSISFAFFLYNKSNTTAMAVQRPFVDLMRASNTTVTYDISRIYASSWYQLFSSLPTPESSGTRKSITASRFITRDSVLNKSEAFARTLEEVGPRAPGTLKNGTPNFSMSGTMTASRKPVNNALNPAWRDTVVHVISSRSWNDAIDPAKADALVRNMTYVPLNALWELEPASGCYFNEANAIEPDWQWSLFGPNYGLLRQIKGKYDPDGML